ncbi:hypothetical protein E2C01_045470 [Portunus trituberculatus]|uniref:Chitin-binding type-2 domain-containing protein n=1 Tax=Portunus trituberculatus TaxID=210409 RepID=A0A5B7FV32_PORTR|nr:hypothetical protein [Portunus trituberculatus]
MEEVVVTVEMVVMVEMVRMEEAVVTVEMVMVEMVVMEEVVVMVERVVMAEMVVMMEAEVLERTVNCHAQKDKGSSRIHKTAVNGFAPYVKRCPFHLHFNPVLRVCDWPHNAKCIATSDSECFVPEPIVPTEPPNLKPDICDCECCVRPHPEDCTSYYYCEPGANAEFHTCSEGLVFDPQLSQCVIQDQYPQCQPEKPPTCDPTCECLYPAEACTEYYKCKFYLRKSVPTYLVHSRKKSKCESWIWRREFWLVFFQVT